jgi:1,4-alpha-glucan branching enzyme
MTSIAVDGAVEFRFFRPLANAVLLAGDFSAWAAQAISMQSTGNGWWLARLRLSQGEYRFRYIADGNWYTDFASHGIEICKHGWNSVLLIPETVKDDQPSNSGRIKDIKAKVAA